MDKQNISRMGAGNNDLGVDFHFPIVCGTARYAIFHDETRQTLTEMTRLGIAG